MPRKKSSRSAACRPNWLMLLKCIYQTIFFLNAIDHYRDLVRQALMQGFERLGGDLGAALKYLDQGRQSLSADEQEALRRFNRQSPDDMEAINNVREGCDREEDRRVVAVL